MSALRSTPVAKKVNEEEALSQLKIIHLSHYSTTQPSAIQRTRRANADRKNETAPLGKKTSNTTGTNYSVQWLRKINN